MAQTLADLQKDVLSRLGECGNSTAGDLPTGTGGAATIATLTTITQYLNEAATDLARSCYPIADNGAYSWSSGTQFVKLSAFAATGAAVLWAVRDVKFGSGTLTHCNRTALANFDPSYNSTASTVPTHWYEQGNDGVGLYPVPSAGPTTVTAYGFTTPAALSEDMDTAIWLQPDLEKLLVFYAAAMIALKNAEDPSLSMRGAEWMGEYQKGKADLLGHLASSDPYLANALYQMTGK